MFKKGQPFNNLLLALCLISLVGGCATKKIETPFKPDPEIERNMASGFSAYNKGDIEKATFYYQKALEKARLANDSEAIGKAAYNYAASLMQNADIPSALISLKEAEAEYAITGNTPPELYLLFANALEKEKKYEEALQKLALIKKAPKELVSQQILLQSRLLYEQNKVQEADQELKKIINNKDNFSALTTILQAEAMELAAELSHIRSDEQATIKYLKKAISLYRKSFAYNKMAETTKNLAIILEQEKNKADAAEYYLQAARSFYYLQNTNTMQQILKQLNIILSDEKMQLHPHTVERISLLKSTIENSSTNIVKGK
jgi:tetratricopeptide (TPR) repeat protein